LSYNKIGALTNKTYAFETRSWELSLVHTIDIFDSLGSSITIYINGSEIKRILPLKNDIVNEDWISDKTRYFFKGWNKWRVNIPLIRKKTSMVFTSWMNGFFFFFLNLWYFSISLKKKGVSFILNSVVDYDLIITTKLLCNLMGFSILKFNNIKQLSDFYLFFINPNFFKDIINKNIYIFLGINLRLESPILNVKLRKKLFEVDFIYCNLGGGLNDNLNSLSLGLNIKNLLFLLRGKLKFNVYVIKLLKKKINNSVTFTVSESINCSTLCLLGLSFFYQKNSLLIYKYLLNKITVLEILNKNMIICKFDKCFSSKLSNLGGCLNINFLNIFSILYEDVILPRVNDNICLLDIIYIVGGNYFFNKKNTNFVVFQGYHIDIKLSAVNIVFPNMTFLEKATKFLNIEGSFFKTNKVVDSPYLVRNDWTILNAFYIYVIRFLNKIYKFNLNISDVNLNFLNSNRFYKNILEFIKFKFGMKYSINYFFDKISLFRQNNNDYSTTNKTIRLVIIIAIWYTGVIRDIIVSNLITHKNTLKGSLMEKL